MLRSARRADAAAIGELLIAAHTAAGDPETGGDLWARDLMERPHPTMVVEDVFVVEDARDGAIVSTLNLIPDCLVANDEARLLLNALFPKAPSQVWPLG